MWDKPDSKVCPTFVFETKRLKADRIKVHPLTRKNLWFIPTTRKL